MTNNSIPQSCCTHMMSCFNPHNIVPTCNAKVNPL